MQLEVITQAPPAGAHPTPILFVHGMWHGAWCWSEHFLPYFAQHGYQSHALSLRGHGASQGRERLRWTPLKDFAADVAQVVDQLERPPILVGHSMGGMVIQKYLESHRAPAAVLLGSGPPTGLIPATLRVARRQFGSFLKANLTLSLIHVVGTPDLYRKAYFCDNLPEQKLSAYHQRVQDESYRAYVDMMMLNLPRPAKVNTPMLVLGTNTDYILSPAEVEATARAYNAQVALFSDIGHAMMLDTGWQSVANRILDWLNQQGL
ncbi:MAG: alpha/beta fold hydrolase [Anaerolineales bacterium]|nr:alpha/beta fold hydrolase [Anaerolineales bacterium]